MAKFKGKALLPWPFFQRYVLPQFLSDAGNWHMLGQQVRKYLLPHDPEKDIPVGQISLRVNEVCNLRCGSCGQWGENGHLRKKLERMFTEQHGQFLAELEQMRRRIIEVVPDPADRKTILGRLVDDDSLEYFVAEGPTAWRQRAHDTMQTHLAKS